MDWMHFSCRICLEEKEKLQFLSLSNRAFEEKTILEVIMDCASIEILNEDLLPQVVCIRCLEKLQSFYELRRLILSSEHILKKKLLLVKELSGKNATLGKDEKTIKSQSSRVNEFKKVNNFDKKGAADKGNPINFFIQNCEIKGQLVKAKCLSNFENGTENMTAENFRDNLKKSLHHTDNFMEQKFVENKRRLKKSIKKFKRTHECQECNKMFQKADHYTVHMTKHTGEKKYVCEFCPKRFARSYVLVYHRRVHTGERPYTCDICSKSFRSPSNFYTHKKIHTGERNHKCEICNESFIQLDSLKIHVRRIHTGERPFMCEVCSSTFRSNSSLLTHKLDMHGKKEVCPICNKQYSSRVLKEHVRRHKEREQGIKRFVCDQCGKRFTTSSSRKKHLLIHSGEKPYSCETCEKSFNQLSALKTHLRIHSDVMPFPCEHCSKSFRYKHHLRSHVNAHHKDALETTVPDNLGLQSKG